MTVVLLEAEDEVYHIVFHRDDLVGLEGLGGTAHDVVLSCIGDGVGMGADIVEVVARDELSGEGLVGKAEAGGSFLTHSRLVEACLITQPSSRATIGHSSIVFEVEALFS